MLLLEKITVNLSDIIFKDTIKLNAMLLNKISVAEPDGHKAWEVYGDIMYEALLTHGYTEFNRMQLYKEVNRIANEIISQYKKGENFGYSKYSK